MKISVPSPQFFESPKALWLFFIIVGLCYLPIPNHSFNTDDYLLYQVLKGSQTLADMGLSNTDPSNPLSDRLANAFNFFSGSQGNLKELQNYGALPWWTEQNSQMVMFRPLAALTHWVDFQLFDKNMYLIQLHSMAWFMFLAWSVFRFYKVILQERFGLVFLASLLYLLDYGHLYNFSWLAARNSYMAVAFACWCLYFHHLFVEKGRLTALFASLGCLSLALLTAEAGIAVSAYLFAYAIALDRRSWLKGLMAIVPAALVVITWRIVYGGLGFGSKGVGLYVDPLYSPLEFIESLFLNYGYLTFSQVSGLLIGVKWFSPESRIYIQIAALVLSFLCLILIVKPLKKLPVMRFFLIGSLISLIPFCAHTSGNVRSLFFCALGFFPVMAFLLHLLWTPTSSKLSKYFVSFVLFCFVLLPLIFKLAFYANAFLNKEGGLSNQLVVEAKNGGGENTKESIVYLTYPNGLAIYLPYRWAFYEKAMPKHIFQFAPGLNSYTVSRESQSQFVLSSKNNFVLTPESLVRSSTGQKPVFDIHYMNQTAHSMTSRPAANFKAGEVFEFTAYKVTILVVDDKGDVSKFKIDFAPDVDINQLEWRYWDWHENRFLTTRLLAVGESMFLPNKWDTEKVTE